MAFHCFYVIYVFLEDQGLPEEIFCNKRKKKKMCNSYNVRHTVLPLFESQIMIV